MTTPSTIPDLIDDAAAKYGDRFYIEEPGISISFQSFRGMVREVAAALIANGVQAGDRVAIWSPNSWQWIVAAYGIQYAGGILVTLNTRNKGAESGIVLRDSGTRLLFSVGNFLGSDYPAMLAEEELPELEKIVTLTSSEQGDISWNAFIQSGRSVSDAEIDSRASAVSTEDTSDILFTSGTTGRPKGVITCHGQNLKAFQFWAEIMGLTQDDRYLAINPFFHTFGYKAGTLVCLMSGATILPHAVFDSEEILKRISREHITVLPGPPTLFQSLLATPDLASHDISSLRATATGAADIPVSLVHQMQEQLGFERIITAYGLTESCGLVTMCRPGDDPETIATTSGRAIDDIELRCVDAENNPVESGTAGEIIIRGYNVMQGYFENPEATREAIDKDGWLHTGDIGVMDERGYLRITGRLKDMFISGGFNCYPAEIENIIASHPAIKMNAVIGIPDERMGEVGMAFVVCREGTDLNDAELINWCRTQMANYKVPRSVKFVDSLPMNASGKVLKGELRDIASATY